MSALPGRPELDRLRRQARELLRAAAANDEQALDRIRAVTDGKGNPVCARLRPPRLTWSAEPA